MARAARALQALGAWTVGLLAPALAPEAAETGPARGAAAGGSLGLPGQRRQLDDQIRQLQLRLRRARRARRELTRRTRAPSTSAGALAALIKQASPEEMQVLAGLLERAMARGLPSAEVTAQGRAAAMAPAPDGQRACQSPDAALPGGAPGLDDERSAARHLALLSRLAPVPCRDDFAVMAQRHFNRTGRAVEVGVFQGDFASKSLRVWRGEYYAIDAWAWRPGDPRDKNFRDKGDNDLHFRMAHNKMKFAGSRVKQIRALSEEAALRFPDGHFDWVFLDTVHTHGAVVADLRLWWPKLRRGGLMSGDDYGDSRDTEYVSVYRYAEDMARQRPDTRNVHTAHEWGVMTAVQGFAKEVGAVLHITWLRDCQFWPAWYMIKP